MPVRMHWRAGIFGTRNFPHFLIISYRNKIYILLFNNLLQNIFYVLKKNMTIIKKLREYFKNFLDFGFLQQGKRVVFQIVEKNIYRSFVFSYTLIVLLSFQRVSTRY